MSLYLLVAFFLAFTSLMSFILILRIILYEKNVNDLFKTLLNDINTLTLYYMLIVITSANLTLILRSILGPLPASLCSLYALIINAGFIAILMTLNEAALTQFVFVFSRFGRFNEDFCFDFIKKLNVLIASFVSAFLVFGSMTPRESFETCHGQVVHMHHRPIYDGRLSYHVWFTGLTISFNMAIKNKVRKKFKEKDSLFGFWGQISFLILVGVAINLFKMLREDEEESGNIADRIPFPQIIINVVIGWGFPAYSLFKRRNRNRVIIV